MVHHTVYIYIYTHTHTSVHPRPCCVQYDLRQLQHHHTCTDAQLTLNCVHSHIYVRTYMFLLHTPNLHIQLHTHMYICTYVYNFMHLLHTVHTYVRIGLCISDHRAIHSLSSIHTHPHPHAVFNPSTHPSTHSPAVCPETTSAAHGSVT